MHDIAKATGMSFVLTEEQEMLRESAERFVRTHYGLEERRKLAASVDGFSKEHWRSFAELGWLGLNLPADAGGLECSFVETCLLMEQFGRGMVLEPFISTIVLGARLVIDCGSHACRHQILPRVVAGDLLLALAQDEGSGRDWSSTPSTYAVEVTDGYRINGNKSVVLAAPSADLLVVSASLAGEFALFLVETKAAGVSVDAYALACGQRAGDVRLVDVLCGKDALLARGPAALEALENALDHARLAAMAQALGVMEACLEQTSEYIRNRRQFGQPLSKFQALQHHIAEMFVDTQDARSMLYQGLAAINGEPAARVRAIAATKIIVGEAGRRMSGLGIQLHGGYGTTDEYAVSWQFRMLFVLDQLFGDSVHHTARLAQRSPLLKL